ncbi:MAG: hypothetical protein WC789_09735 [Lentisphaeria bacterium]|jgi:hypothetical protein
MNCYNHPERPAVGFCKSCCKGLCGECAAELPNGLACRNACEGRVTLINQIIDSNQQILAAANRQVRSSGWFVLLLGLVLGLFGILPFALSRNPATLFLVVIGLFFVAYGAARLLKKANYYSMAKQ